MRSSLRLSLSLAALSLAPMAMHAQTCPTGFTYTPLPGGGFSCTPTAAAPEIGVSSSVAGFAVLLGGAAMLRGRKRAIRIAEAV